MVGVGFCVVVDVEIWVTVCVWVACAPLLALAVIVYWWGWPLHANGTVSAPLAPG